jgi:hypothetical protein
LVVAVWTRFVSVFVAETIAFGMTAPVVSVTWPVRLALVPWPNAIVAEIANSINVSVRNRQ